MDLQVYFGASSSSSNISQLKQIQANEPIKNLQRFYPEPRPSDRAHQQLPPSTMKGTFSSPGGNQACEA